MLIIIANMIEIEKKFKLNQEEKERLLIGADFLGEKIFTDVYFDTADFTLTKNDIWLRRRGNSLELKLPIYQAEKKEATQYQEITGEEKIREIFAVAPVLDFENDIKVFGYEAFCKLKTVRKEHLKSGFIIDFDKTTSDIQGEQDFNYQIVEIELLVENINEILSANKKIEKFAKINNLKFERIRGKVAEYLSQKRPKHFKALVEAGVVEVASRA